MDGLIIWLIVNRLVSGLIDWLIGLLLLVYVIGLLLLVGVQSLHLAFSSSVTSPNIIGYSRLAVLLLLLLLLTLVTALFIIQ